MSPPRGFFVTGTGTDVGKRVVADVIARAAAERGERVRVFKPAVSGLDDGGESDHALLRRAAGSPQSDEEIAPYRYGPPVSPHLGAEMEDEEIDPQRLLATAAAAREGSSFFVCEGVGGILVPLAPGYLIRNLAADLALPLVIVAPPGLGTINHTLLTIEAAWTAELDIHAVVLNRWPKRPTKVQRSNRETIAELGGVEVLTLPKIDLEDMDGWPDLGLL
ncbi:MAG: dethiobiotin synthase [Solirubrobacterales bacterium]|nr:dethiobiotin synthase [Solirubrobacterales bacterium]